VLVRTYYQIGRTSAIDGFSSEFMPAGCPIDSIKASAHQGAFVNDWPEPDTSFATAPVPPLNVSKIQVVIVEADRGTRPPGAQRRGLQNFVLPKERAGGRHPDGAKQITQVLMGGALPAPDRAPRRSRAV
jgi:hypothetical protein